MTEGTEPSERTASARDLPTVGELLRTRFGLSEKGPRVLLGFVALFLLVATSSELWFSNQDSFFNKSGLITSPVFPTVVTFLLILLQCFNWKRISGKLAIGDMVEYGLLCAAGDILLMAGVTLIVYVGIGEMLPLDLNQYWKIFYLGIALAAGEFALSSMISGLLKKAIALKLEVDDSRRHLDALVEEAKELSAPVLPDSIDDKKVIDK